MFKFSKTAEMSLLEATKPLLVLSRLIGMNPKSNWHKIYTVFVLVLHCVTLWKLWLHYSNMNFEYYYFNVLVHVLQDICRTSSLLIVLGSGFFDRERFMVPLSEFASVDDILESFGRSIDNRDTYRFEILLVGYIGLLPIFSWVTDLRKHPLMEGYAQMYRVVVMGWLHKLIIIIFWAVTDSLFIVTLSIMRRRFREINSIIHHSAVHGLYLRVNFLEDSRSCASDNVLRELRILRKQYHDLWEIANRVNNAYGLHLLLGATAAFVLVTSKLWEGYHLFLGSGANRQDRVACCFLAGLFYVTRIFLLVKASASTVAEAKAIFVVLQDLGMKGYWNPATKGEIRDFFTQLQLEARNFTACGFFDIDFKLLSTIIGAVCTYLVILIQMSDSKSDCLLTACQCNESINYSVADDT